MVIPQPPDQYAGGFRVSGPFLHALGIAQRGQPFQQIDKACWQSGMFLPFSSCGQLSASLVFRNARSSFGKMTMSPGIS